MFEVLTYIAKGIRSKAGYNTASCSGLVASCCCIILGVINVKKTKTLSVRCCTKLHIAAH